MPEMDPISQAYYCTVDDVRLINELQPSELSNDRITALIEKSQSEIDANLASTISVPFTLGEVPPKVRWMCADLAASYSLMKVYIGTAPNQSPYGAILHRRVMEQVKRIREGLERIVNASGTDLTSDVVKSSTPYAQAIFTRGAYKDATTMNLIEDATVGGSVEGARFSAWNFYWWYCNG